MSHPSIKSERANQGLSSLTPSVERHTAVKYINRSPSVMFSESDSFILLKSHKVLTTITAHIFEYHAFPPSRRHRTNRQARRFRTPLSKPYSCRPRADIRQSLPSSWPYYLHGLASLKRRHTHRSHRSTGSISKCSHHHTEHSPEIRQPLCSSALTSSLPR